METYKIGRFEAARYIKPVSGFSPFIAASLTVHFVVDIAGMLTALAIGIGFFGAPMPSHVPGVQAVCSSGSAPSSQWVARLRRSIRLPLPLRA